MLEFQNGLLENMKKALKTTKPKSLEQKEKLVINAYLHGLEEKQSQNRQKNQDYRTYSKNQY